MSAHVAREFKVIVGKSTYNCKLLKRDDGQYICFADAPDGTLLRGEDWEHATVAVASLMELILLI